MKYIRTKESVYELIFLNDEQRISFDHKTIEPAYLTTQRDWVAKKDVIKESDNIEDLLDETVAFYKDGTKFTWGTFPIEEVIGFYRVNKNKEPQLDFLGGYIWVCDNLMKVAKLTDEGWELV